MSCAQLLQLWRVADLQALGAALRAGGGGGGGARPLLADTDLRIMRPATRAKLRQFADSGLGDFDFDRILDAVRYLRISNSHFRVHFTPFAEVDYFLSLPFLSNSRSSTTTVGNLRRGPRGGKIN